MAHKKAISRSASGAQTIVPNDRPVATDRVEVNDPRGNVVHYDCGHDYESIFTVHLFGTEIKMDYSSEGKRLLCGPCSIKKLRPMYIQCAVCGHAIQPGEPVGAYERIPDMIESRCTPVSPEELPNFVISCNNWWCNTGKVVYGNWTGENVETNSKRMIALVKIEAGKAVPVHVLNLD